MVTMFLSSLRKRIPRNQQDSYILAHQSLEYLREPMGMTNKHVGYVFLVDPEMRIRSVPFLSFYFSLASRR